jgi:hypothetical protein
MCKSEVSFPFAERDLHWPVLADFLSSSVTNTKITTLSPGSFTPYVHFIVAYFSAKFTCLRTCHGSISLSTNETVHQIITFCNVVRCLGVDVVCFGFSLKPQHVWKEVLFLARVTFFTVVLLKMDVFWNVPPCRLVNSYRCREATCVTIYQHRSHCMLLM